MLSLLRSGEAFPFLGEAERERERERDLFSADADRSLQKKGIVVNYRTSFWTTTVGGLQTGASKQNQRKHERKNRERSIIIWSHGHRTVAKLTVNGSRGGWTWNVSGNGTRASRRTAIGNGSHAHVWANGSGCGSGTLTWTWTRHAICCSGSSEVIN